MPESDPLRQIREKLLALEAGKSVELSLSAGEAEALTEALERAEGYYAIHGAWLYECAKARRIDDVRDEFQRVQGRRIDQRALEAVDDLGWKDTGDGVRRRGHTLLFHYQMLTTGEGTSEGACYLFAPPGIHPQFAPRRNWVAVRGVPLTKEDAVQVLADWYGTSILETRKRLMEAKRQAKRKIRELVQQDDDLSRFERKRLVKLIEPALPSNG